MSCSTLYILNKVSVTEYKEYRNGHGTAPVIWDYLSIKYLGLKGTPWGWSGEGNIQQLWDLANDPRLSKDEVIVHRMCFDHEYVSLDKLQLAADSCRTFFPKSIELLGDGRVNHWQTIGDDLEILKAQKLNRFARGVCLNCTSVNNYLWDWKGNPEMRVINC